MGFRTGEMTQRVAIQSKVPESVNTFGEAIPASWATLDTVWAMINPIGGQERNQADQIKALRSHVVSMRHYPTMVASFRLLWGTKELNIVKVIDPGSRGCDTILDVLEAEVV